MTATTRRLAWCLAVSLGASTAACRAEDGRQPTPPNIVLIYADDLGYGDVSSYGATALRTPNIDRLATEGLRFTNAHAPAATCTPSRYAMLTGEYAWRRPGTGIARGDAPLIIPTSSTTLATILKRAGYATAVVGKWHLGLGPETGPDWNGDLTPGPLDLGFDYAFLMPATGDRVPTVYVENRRVVDLDPADPIEVSFAGPIGDEPTGASHPDQLRIRPSHGHDQTIVNGISRIGYMTGGRTARWVDEDMADVFVSKAVRYVEEHREEPFFLYFSTHDIHVPRTPHPRFVGRSGLGPRGDATVQLDWSVGELLAVLDRLDLAGNTLIIFQRQRPGARRRLRGSGRRARREPRPDRRPARRKVQRIRGRHARALPRQVAGTRAPRCLERARFSGGLPDVARVTDRSRARRRRGARQSRCAGRPAR
jgi:arylsulfatase A-like enzyme